MLISFILVKTTESCTNNTFKSTFIWDQGYRHESQELITWSRCGLLRAQFSDRLSQLLQWASYVQYVHKQRYAHRIVDGTSTRTYVLVNLRLERSSSRSLQTQAFVLKLYSWETITYHTIIIRSPPPLHQQILCHISFLSSFHHPVVARRLRYVFSLCY